MEGDNGLLQGTVEEFAVSVHFLGGLVPPIGDVVLLQCYFEVFHELRAVVGEQITERNRGQFIQGVQCRCRLVAVAGC